MGRHYVASAGYPDGVGCNGCHNAHATTRYDALTVEDGVIAACEDCHADKVRDSGTGMTVGFSGARLECIDCHMPLLSKSALSSAGLGSGPATGDIASHIFKIDPAQSEQFTADGGLSFPYLTTTFACLPCHGGDPESVSFIDLTGLDLTGFTFHYPEFLRGSVPDEASPWPMAFFLHRCAGSCQSPVVMICRS
jgi:predicted CXXCH cytochrome family protein